MSSLSDAPDLLLPLPGPVAALDFRTVGVVWTVRPRGGGARRTFSTLQTLREAWQQGEVGDDDALTSDGCAWRFLGRIDSLEALFEETWRQAQADSATIAAPGELPQVEEVTRIQRAPTLAIWPAPQPPPPPAVTPPTQWGWTAVAFGVGSLGVVLLGYLLLR